MDLAYCYQSKSHVIQCIVLVNLTADWKTTTFATFGEWSTLTFLSPLSSIQVYASSAYDSGYDHDCDDAGISDSSEKYINQDERDPIIIQTDSWKGTMMV